MLERIFNITAGSDFRQSSARTSKQAKAYRHFDEFHAASNDSISFSPATSFLSEINWKLKKIQNAKEKIYLVFSFDGMEFSTMLFLGDMTQLNLIDYEINYKIVSTANGKELNAKVVTPLKNNFHDLFQYRQGLPVLKNFFNEILELDGGAAFLSAASRQVQELFINVESELFKEFDYINKCLLNFLEKFLSFGINVRGNSGKQENLLELKFLQIKNS